MKKILLLLFTALNFTAYGQLAMEGFEGTWLPAGWAVYNVSGTEQMWGQTQAGNVNLPSYQGNYAAFIEKENVETGMSEDWLVTPQFTVPQNGVVSFFSRLTISGNQNTVYEVRLLNGAEQSNLAAYTLVQQFTEDEINPAQQEYHQHVLNLPVESYGQQVYLAFIMKGDDGDRWLLDNVMITTACTAPTNLTATNVTPTSATLQWEASDSNEWEIEFAAVGAPFTGQGEIVDENYYELTSLVPGSYKFIVRSLCEGITSTWAGPYSFSTIENTANTVSGAVQYDVDGNGSCSDGVSLPFVEVEVTVDNNYTYSTYTNAEGEYTLYNLPNGSSTISLQAMPPTGFDEAVPVTQEVIFGTGDTEESIDLCLAQPDLVNDLSVTFSPVNSARPDFDAHYVLTVTNTGTSIISQATVNVTFDDNRLDFISADTPTSMAGNTVTFTLNNIMPFSNVQHDMVFYVLAPEINWGGEILNYTVSLSSVEEDTTPENNTTVLNQTIVNSFDPNDITVHEGGQIYLDQADDYLTYTIRFQNTGSAEAITVKLENELDEMLDPETFQPIMGSHNFTVTRSTNVLVFTFNDINLPHSGADEPASHGYVTYRIKPNEDFGLNDVVLNTANIYFDSNPVVPTNTVTTVVIENLGTNSNAINTIALYPNPVDDRLHIALREGNVVSSGVKDINGRTVSSIIGQHNIIDTSTLTKGIYFVTITTDTGSSTYKIIKK